MACFTDFHSRSAELEDDANLTILQLDKTKKILTVFRPELIIRSDICRVDIERILGWVSWTTNREYNKLNPYFRENARIIATKIE